MRIINWVLLWLCSTFNLWKKIIGTKFRIRAWFYLMKTIPKIWIFPLFLAKQRSPWPGHLRPGAALAWPGAARARLRAASPRGCARSQVARGCASPPGFGWEGEERERERGLGGEEGSLRGRRELGFGWLESSEFLQRRKKFLLSDSHVRGGHLAKRPLTT